MRTCAHAHSETPSANKITKKIEKKQRWPSEKKNTGTSAMFQCVRAYMCAHAQRNHSLKAHREIYMKKKTQKEFWEAPQ